MSYRPLAAVLSGAAVLAVLVPFVGSAGAAACPTWTDASGDASPFDAGAPQNGALDILETTVSTTGTDVAVSIRVAALSATPTAYGDEYAVEMTVGGQTLLFYADRTPGLGTTAAVWNSSNETPPDGVATATFDVPKNTVTISAKQSEVDAAAGKPTKGLAATGLLATTALQVAAVPVPPYDDSAAPASMTYAVGNACTTAGPTPTGSATPTASPTASPTATPSPTGSPTPSPTASPSTPPGTLPEGYPTAGCTTFTDAAGDGTPDAPVSNGGAPVAEASNDPDLDVVGVALGTTPTEFVAFVMVDDLVALPETGNGHQFDVTFTHNAKTINIYAQQVDQVAGAARTAIGSTPLGVVPTTGGKVGTTYNAGLKVTSAFDVANDVVILRLTRESLEAVAGAPAPDGTTVTTVAAASRMITPTGGYATADTAQDADAAKRTFTFGDSPCFAPPPATLVNTGKTTVQFTDAAAVAAKLTNAAGEPLAGKAVRFAVGSKAVTATTGADGVAKASLNPAVAAGAYSLVTTFAGDASAGEVALTTPFTVTAEKTKITLSVRRSGTKRTVTAKLVDDDGRAVAGQVVAWYVNGRKVSSPRTSSTGTVTLTTAKAGQTVKAALAAVRGKYAAATAQAKV